MPSPITTTTTLTLPLLSALGFYLTWHLLLHNGTTHEMANLRDVGPHLLPGTAIPLKTSYVGITWFDYQLTVLDVFFWEMVDGSRPGGSLFCFHFAGQVFAGWALLVVEGLRGGNGGRVVAFVALWGVALQNLAFAVVMPIYLALHLFTSPTVYSRRWADYKVDVIDAYSIPVAMVLGYAIPTVMMALPAPSILDYATKQNLMAIWQFFPVWVAMIQPMVAFLIISFGKIASKESAASGKASMKPLRFVYGTLLTVAGVNQISTFTIVALSKFFPKLFASSYIGAFSLEKVFLPQGITPATKMGTIGEGALMLLQYDNYTGSFAIALWATVLLVQGYRNQQREMAGYVQLVLYGIVLLALTGPLGYTAACLWARDELVVDGESDEKKVQ